MSETKVTVSLELVDKAAQKALNDFIGKSDSADKGLKNLGDSGKKAFGEIGVHIGKSLGVYDIFVGNLAANVAIKAFDALAGAASNLFNLFVTDGIAAAQAQEEANNDLNIALAQTGIYSKKTATEIQDYATALQGTTGVQDDVILKNAALIQNLAQLDKDGLKRATSAALDLSAALGKDLGSASEALGKAANGNITALQKMGLTIEKGQTNTETFNNALQALENRFGGSAAAKINTYSGAVQFATNQFGDLQEEFGNIVTQNNVVIAVWKEAGKIIGEFTGSVKGNNQAWKEWVGDGLILVLKGLEGLASAMDVITKVFKGSVEIIAYPFKVLASSIEAAMLAAEGKFSQAWDVLKNGAKDAALEVGTAFTEDTSFVAIGDTLAQLQGAAEQGFIALKNGADTTIEPINQVKQKVYELSEEQKRANDQLKEWALNLAKADSDAQGLFASRIETLKLENDAKKISDEEYFTAKKDALDELNTVEEEKLQTALDKKLITQTQHSAALTSLERKRSLEALKIQEEQRKKEDELNKLKIEAVKNTFGNLASLMQTTSRELFEIGKAAAIASATINTYEAITKTMASVPFPFNIPLAVAQGIAGFVQVSNISRQQPGFEQGGIVPGTSFSGDNVGVSVNSGEMILNRSQQSELFKVANGNSGPSGLVEEMRAVRNLLGAVLSMPISVNVDGKELFRVIRDGLSSGRSLA